MCGIFFSVSSSSFVEPQEETIEQLRARGPDSCQKYEVAVTTGRQNVALTTESSSYHLTFLSTVLALRGSIVQVQPLVDEKTGSVLCWNGEAWKVDGEELRGNDTTHIYRLLLAAAASSQANSCQSIVAALASIAGPFSFVFFNAQSSNIYYGRDRLGRRSLMETGDRGAALVLSSVSRITSTADTEVGTDGIYCVDLNEAKSLQPRLWTWPSAAPIINRIIPSNSAVARSIAPSTVRHVEHKLSDSIRLRVADVPDIATARLRQKHAKVAVLFSGGLDCTVLARLTHDLIPPDEPIDLLNVAFYNPRYVAANPFNTLSPYESCPDRITGRSSFRELCQTCPSRNWQFVAVNVPFEDVHQFRALIIRLMCPHNTEMDLSIAMALFFAARGQGYLDDAIKPTESDGVSTAQSYKTTARVLLSGLGADELFAGYTRHSNAFSRQGYTGLINELDLDFQRIGKRNLGRDDRVISYWGKEVRYPYLDEDFVQYALRLPVWQKCGFGQQPSTKEIVEIEPQTASREMEKIEPGKKLLRLLALSLSLEGVAREKKRAIQFGARTAKMEAGQGRRKGTDVLS